MQNAPLFKYAPTIDFSEGEKRAELDLGEDQAQWYRKILTELYRTLPEASQYAPEVRMLRTDDEQGFALGVVTLDGSTDSALTEQSTPNKTTNTVHIPVIVKHHIMQPLDVMLVRGRVLPLNAPRLREALFRPMGLELLTEDWGDTSILSMFNLPGRSDVYPGSGTTNTVGGDGVQTLFGSGMKMSKYELLELVAPTMLHADATKLASTLEDPALQRALASNPAYLGGVKVLAEAEPPPGFDAMLKAAADEVGTDVVQLGYDDGLEQYVVKSASRGAFYPLVTAMDRGEFLKFAGDEVARKVDTEGTVTIASPSARAKTPKGKPWSPVEKSGVYTVRTPSGEEHTGWVLANLLDFDGTRAPMAVFSGDGTAAVQSQIAGVKAGAGADLPSAKPKGAGVFYARGEGGLVATVPVNVSATTKDTDGSVVYRVSALTSGDHDVHVTPGIKGIRAAKGDLFIGTDVRFLPLDAQEMLPLVEDADSSDKTASLLCRTRVTVLTDGNECTLGFEGLPKIASIVPAGSPVSKDDAIFALCLAGLGAQDAYTKVAQAELGQVTLHDLKDVVTLEEHAASVTKTASAESRQAMALRRDLTKEASVLPDVQTVDSVLSLGLLNSENLRSYIAKLPYLEKSLGILGHLLLASRLGLTEVPEAAAARCVRGLDEVCRGLSALGLRDLSDGEI